MYQDFFFSKNQEDEYMHFIFGADLYHKLMGSVELNSFSLNFIFCLNDPLNKH